MSGIKTENEAEFFVKTLEITPEIYDFLTKFEFVIFFNNQYFILIYSGSIPIIIKIVSDR